MKIALNWKNRTPDAEGTRIYRSDTPMVEGILPAPIATLAPELTEYLDTDVQLGDKFYYRTEVFRGELSSLSSEIEAYALPRTGPGPQQLIAGDSEIGIYGTVPANEFINGPGLASRLGLALIPTNPDVEWLKYAYKGKVLFIPRLPLGRNLSWQILYNAGLVYGVDGFGDASRVNIAGVNQLRTIDINGEQFLVRLMKGAPSAPATYANYSVSPPRDSVGLDGSEWNDLFYPTVNNQRPISQRVPDFYNLTPNALLGSNYELYSSMTLCQETTGGTGVLIRGGGYTEKFLGHANSIPYGSVSLNTYVDSGTQTYYPGWRPVLEWIP